MTCNHDKLAENILSAASMLGAIAIAVADGYGPLLAVVDKIVKLKTELGRQRRTLHRVVEIAAIYNRWVQNRTYDYSTDHGDAVATLKAIGKVLGEP